MLAMILNPQNLVSQQQRQTDGQTDLELQLTSRLVLTRLIRLRVQLTAVTAASTAACCSIRKQKLHIKQKKLTS